MHTWQTELKNSITTLSELLNHLKLTQLPTVQPQDFPLRVPRPFLNRMKPCDPKDPLLLQVLPQAQENIAVPGFSLDPLKEQSSIKIPGLLHKYPGRVLLTLTGGCAINCRYCFRRHFPYQANVISHERAKTIIEYIHNDPSIYEIILSGGDPLIAKDEQLSSLLHAFNNIPHLKYLRIHTRLPVVIPARVTHEFVTLLTSLHLKTSVVLHCNHANEIDTQVEQAVKKLTAQGITLLNQSVLLAGINDKAETLAALSHRLYSISVLPYYLHLLDPVQGTHHFNVTDDKAKRIMQHLQDLLPGYLVPKLVRETAGLSHKTLIAF